MPRAPRRCPGKHGNCSNLIRGRKYCADCTVAWAGDRTASSRITKTYEWQQFRKFILQRDGYTCKLAYPGICTGYATHVDKKRPAARRPDLALDPGNAQAACAACNEHKARTADKRAGFK